MMETIIIYLGLMCITVLSVNATPVLLLRDKLGLYEINDNNSFFKNKIIELLSCPMCLGVWIGLIGLTILSNTLTYIILGSAIISIGSEILNKILRM